MTTDEYPLVLVEWEDHTGSAGWKTVREVQDSKPAICVTIGWLVHEDKQSVKVCNSLILSENDEVGGESLILKRDIVKREEIVFRKRKCPAR